MGIDGTETYPGEGERGREARRHARCRATTMLPVAVLTALFSTPLAARIVVVEIHYHPAGADQAAALEFVELYNDEPLAFDVSGYRLRGGVDYRFPPGALIEGHGVVVVAGDPARVAGEYGIELPFGPFAGRLANGGDDVQLLDTGGSTVCRVRYNDRGRWPSAADGAGPSLVLRSPIENPAESRSWGWSPVRGGTPGVASFDTVESEVLINEVGRGAGGGWVELFNRGKESAAVSGFRLWTDSAGRESVPLPPDTSIAPRSFMAIGGIGGLRRDRPDPALLLVAADGERIVDARRLGALPDGESEGRHPDGGDRWLVLEPATRGGGNRLPEPPPLVISEIHYRPHSDDEDDEFVELANLGNEAVDLEGYRFTAGIDYVFPADSVIAPGGYLVVAKDPARIEDLYDTSGVLGSWEGVLANAGEMLRLRDPRGNPVDEVRYYDGGSWPRWADGDGPSLELADLRQDNSVGAPWRESDHGSLSEWVQHEYSARQGAATDSEFHLFLLGAGETLVDDIEVLRPGSDENHVPGGDFDGPDPLAGWRMDGTHVESRIAEGAGPDGSNALLVVASKRGDTRVNRIERQTRPNLVRGVEYTVRFKARWLRGSDLLMTRSFRHGIARVTRLEVPPLGGTPGRANSRAVKDSGPVISDVRQEPVLPAPGDGGDRVTVEARIRDADGIREARLHYRLDRAEAFAIRAMADDGRPPDRLADDGVFAGVIPAMGSRGAIAEYWIEAVDGGGLVRTFPPEAPGDALIYQYDDGIPARDIPAYRVLLRFREFSLLRTRSPHSNHLLPAALVYRDERIFQRARLRYRGSPFLRRDSLTGSRKGLRVNLTDQNKLRNSTRITLDEQAADPTFQVDRLVRHFLQKAGGIPYGERRHVHLILRGASAGLYEEVLTVDRRYLERSFGDDNIDGDLYKVDAHYELDDREEFGTPAFTSWRWTDDKEKLRFTYKKRDSGKSDDYSDLMELLDLMDVRRTTNEEFDRRAPEMIDLDLWVRGIAVFRTVEDWDTIGGWTGKNIYLYHHPDGRWRYIPWDHDVALGAAALMADHNARAYLYTPYFPEIRRLLGRPSLDRRFLAEISRLLSEDYDRRVVDPVLDTTWELLRRTGARSPTAIKSFIGARRAHILSQLPREPAFALQTNGGEPFTTEESRVTLSGTAPWRVESILATGTAAPAPSSGARWVERTTWELEVDLVPGRRRVEVLGFDARGNIVGAAGTEITWNAPEGVFRRGDVDGDGRVTVSDAVRTLRFLFGRDALSCPDAADVDDSGLTDLTDAVYILDFLFRGGPLPRPPFPQPGPDPSPDALVCE